MKARSAKAKGTKLEVDTVKAFESANWKAHKQPGSGIYQGWPHDVEVTSPHDSKYVVECKNHKSPLKTLRKWMGDCEMLVHKANFEEPWITMTLATFMEIVHHDDD
jgi:Holliday junction resolvase